MSRISNALPLILGAAAFATACGGDGNNPSNIPPDASFTRSCTHLACDFANSSSDPDGLLTGYAWDFGDGSKAISQNTSHLYGSAGSYVVELTVTDDKGAKGNLLQQVTVTAAPSANIQLSQTTFAFSARSGPPALLNAPLDITTTSPDPLDWTASSPNSGWLSISPTSGTAPSSNVTVSVNTAKLGGGTYHGSITISAVGAAAISSRTISVTLRLR